MKKWMNISLTITILLFGSILTGCAAMPQVSAVDDEERDAVLTYAEPIADNMFTAMNDWDYAAFSRDFDPTMEKAMKEENFNEMMAFFQDKIGAYQSRTVEKVELVDDLYVITYQAAFDQDDPVTIRLSVREGDPPQVGGIYFDSPKLREK